MAAQAGVCRYCGEFRPLVKSHIIPEAFFRALGKGHNSPLLITSVSSVPHPKRVPIGVYDTQILCQSCERQFDEVDAYGTKLLLHTLRGSKLKPVKRGLDVVGFQVGDVNQQLLKRFFIATLWRASVSTQPFFARVRLGPHYENIARKTIHDGPIPPVFNVAMAGFLDSDGYEEAVGFMDPIFERYNGVNVYRFCFGAYIAYIKVDRRPFSDVIRHTALEVQPSLIIVRRDYASSRLLKMVSHEGPFSLKRRAG